MKLLLLATAYNGLTQRAHLELQAAGHEVYLELTHLQESSHGQRGAGQCRRRWCYFCTRC
jgi:hypothetical protein